VRERKLQSHIHGPELCIVNDRATPLALNSYNSTF
jgi:hypothetical protein